jgi:hypothetical protein
VGRNVVYVEAKTLRVGGFSMKNKAERVPLVWKQVWADGRAVAYFWRLPDLRRLVQSSSGMIASNTHGKSNPVSDF